MTTVSDKLQKDGLAEQYAAHFDGEPDFVRAPARINIIGEHTDYNNGLVLPTTTALHTVVAWARRDDDKLTVHSHNTGETHGIVLTAGELQKTGGWFDYVLGVVSELQKEGVSIRGVDMLVDSDIPIGGGLSSSASLELAISHALLEASGETMDPLVLAQVCQRAESDTVGLKCGIMDQYAIACCERGSAMLIDCRTLDAEFVDIPANAALLVVDSGVKHRLPDGEYNDRRAECEQALERLQQERPELRSLCDLSSSHLPAYSQVLDDVLYRRCLHVVSENRRVAEAVAALRRGDLELLGAIISESHASLCNDFEVSCEESDQLVEVLSGQTGVYGARQIGAGFGGCVLALVDRDLAESIGNAVAGQIAGDSEVWWHVVRPADPAGPFGEDASSPKRRASASQ